MSLPAQAQESLSSRIEAKVRQFMAEKKASLSLGFVLLDGKERLLINADQVAPAASTIKLLIAMEAYREMEQGTLSPTELICLKASDIVDGGPTSSTKPGTTFTVRELIEKMLIFSDNTATNLVIKRITMEKVNALGKRIGLSHTVLQRKMMDFVSRAKGKDNFTTAADMLVITEKIIHGTVISKEHSEELLGILKWQYYRTRIPRLLPKDVVIANKTGDLPGGIAWDVAVIYHQKTPYILCLFSKELTEDAFGELSKIIFDEVSSQGR
jgi:beta-lactamase class A